VAISLASGCSGNPITLNFYPDSPLRGAPPSSEPYPSLAAYNEALGLPASPPSSPPTPASPGSGDGDATQRLSERTAYRSFVVFHFAATLVALDNIAISHAERTDARAFVQAYTARMAAAGLISPASTHPSSASALSSPAVSGAAEASPLSAGVESSSSSSEEVGGAAGRRGARAGDLDAGEEAEPLPRLGLAESPAPDEPAVLPVSAPSARVPAGDSGPQTVNAGGVGSADTGIAPRPPSTLPSARSAASSSAALEDAIRRAGDRVLAAAASARAELIDRTTLEESASAPQPPPPLAVLSALQQSPSQPLVASPADSAPPPQQPSRETTTPTSFSAFISPTPQPGRAVVPTPTAASVSRPAAAVPPAELPAVPLPELQTSTPGLMPPPPPHVQLRSHIGSTFDVTSTPMLALSLPTQTASAVERSTPFDARSTTSAPSAAAPPATSSQSVISTGSAVLYSPGSTEPSPGAQAAVQSMSVPATGTTPAPAVSVQSPGSGELGPSPPVLVETSGVARAGAGAGAGVSAGGEEASALVRVLATRAAPAAVPSPLRQVLTQVGERDWRVREDGGLGWGRRVGDGRREEKRGREGERACRRRSLCPVANFSGLGTAWVNGWGGAGCVDPVAITQRNAGGNSSSCHTRLLVYSIIATREPRCPCRAACWRAREPKRQRRRGTASATAIAPAAATAHSTTRCNRDTNTRLHAISGASATNRRTPC